MSEQDWTLEEIQAFDKLLEGIYIAGKVGGPAQAIVSATAALQYLLMPTFYKSFPTLEDFMKFMHEDPRVQDALRRST